MSLRRALLAVLGFTVFVGLVISEEPLEDHSKGMQFDYEDSVIGQGNFASNNKIISQGPHADPRLPNKLAKVYLQKINHGSGSIEKESIITSNESTRTWICPDMIYAFGLIGTMDNHSMVYRPQTMSIGNGYYAAHPVSFNSLLGDMTQIKNYASKTSMKHEIDYAHGISMDLVASVEDDYSGWEPAKSLTRTLMNLNGGVTSGTARLEMLQGGSRKSKSSWVKPNIDVDQVYTGTFDFATEMNLTVPVYKSVTEDSWLPCCSDGWKDMMLPDKRAFGTTTKGIFDCTCFNGHAKA